MTTPPLPEDEIRLPAIPESILATAPDQITDVARALWDVLREVEDRCDMELEDIGSSHVVWQLANVAIAAVGAAQPAKCLTCGGSGWIGGPSYYNPGEGGEPCADCAPAHPQVEPAWCPRCGCGNDAAGFAHLSGCIADHEPVTVPVVAVMLDGDAAQAHDQCRAVVHLALALAEVYSARAAILAAGQGPIEIIGESSAAAMEWLGDELSNMDGIDEADMWTDPIFDAAHARWPVASQAAPDDGTCAFKPGASLVADILKDCCECERPNHWDVETVELRVSDLTMILERHIEGKE